jgi:hypothetical protein
MANFTFYGSVLPFYNATTLLPGPNAFVISNGIYSDIFIGSFSFTGANSNINVFGRLTALEEYSNNSLVAKITGLDADANTAWGLLKSGSVTGMFSYLLSGNDQIVGTVGDDSGLKGFGGNDLFRPGLGRDTIDGGDGTDTVVVPGASYDCGFGINFDNTQINLWSGSTMLGQYTMSNVETVSFTDRTISVAAIRAIDWVAPYIQDYSLRLYGPNFINVPLQQSFTFTLNEIIKLGEGRVVIYEEVSGKIFETFVASSSSNISFNNNTFSIVPTKNFEAGKLYTIRIEDSAILDIYGNGISQISFSFNTVQPTYSLAGSFTSVNEGSTATFTLSSTNVAAGTQVAYTLSGVSAADVQGGALTGTAIVDSGGLATISVALLADTLTEGAETLTVTAGGKTASTTVNDTSTGISAYSITASSASVNEGSTATFTLSSTNVAAGTQVAYTLSGVSAADVQSGALTGTATIGANGQAIITVALVADSLIEGVETLTVTAGGQAASIAINDTSKNTIINGSTYFLTGSSSVFEGGAFDLTVLTTYVPDGTKIPYYISGISKEDVLDEQLTGTITIQGSSGYKRIYLSYDSLLEGPETISVTLMDRSVSGVVLDTSTPQNIAIVRAATQSVNEGEKAIFIVQTTNIPVGTAIPYILLGVQGRDVAGATLQSAVSVRADGQAVIEIYTNKDRFTDPETLTVKINANSFASVIVNDTSTGPNTILTPNDDLLNINSQSILHDIDGGLGNDTVSYANDPSKMRNYARNEVNVSYDGNVIQIKKDPYYDVDIGTFDRLTNVERVKFIDGVLVFDVKTSNAPAAYRLYGGAFDRTPDEGGFRFWAGVLDRGVSLRDVAKDFIASEEFVGRYGSSLSNSAFVDALYLNILDRPGEAGGVAFWNRVLDNKALDRAEVLVEFTQLPEFVGISAANTTNGYWVV